MSNPSHAPAIRAERHRDLVDTAADTGVLGQWSALVDAAGLGATLRGIGPFTLLAPRDAAFASRHVRSAAEWLRPENKVELIGLLARHVLPGRFMTRDFLGTTMRIRSMQGMVLTIGGEQEVVIHHARIVRSDIECANGVIHVVDELILPPAL